MPETWMDIFKRYKPEITEKEAEYILWNETCYPLDAQTTIIQIENYFKNKSDEPKTKSH